MAWQQIFHLVGAVQFFYGCYYDQKYVNFPHNSSSYVAFGGKLKYLTYLDAILLTVYFTIAFLNDLIGTNEPNPPEKPVIRKVKDTLFSCIAFPLALFVGLSFWGIYMVDRELILPKAVDAFFPTWLNHVMHTNIAIFVFIELFASFRMYPSRKQGLSILILFMACYLVWLHVIYFSTGYWVYPILNVLNWPLKVFFFAFCLSLVCGLYHAGETLNKIVWEQQIDKTLKSRKKKAK